MAQGLIKERCVLSGGKRQKAGKELWVENCFFRVKDKALLGGSKDPLCKTLDGFPLRPSRVGVGSTQVSVRRDPRCLKIPKDKLFTENQVN